MSFEPRGDELRASGLSEPPKRLIRFTWSGRVLESAQVENFLLEGQILRSRYRILRFVRNESHADVYLATTIYAPFTQFRAHVFFEGLEDNWKTYASRKMKRMRKKEEFHASFEHEGSEVILMRVEESQLQFKVVNYHREFPTLVGSGREPHDELGILANSCRRAKIKQRLQE